MRHSIKREKNDALTSIFERENERSMAEVRSIAGAARKGIYVMRTMVLVAAMIVGAGENWAETTDGVNYCGKSDVNDGKNLVWYVTEEETDGVKTLHIDKNPAVTDANADFSMADYENNNGNFAPWIKPNDEGNRSDGLRYGITAVAIGAGVTSIGKKAFDGCWDIFSKTGLTSVTFAEGSQLKSIGECAFLGCEGLTTMTLPSSLTTISNNVFGGCGFTDVTIPASVTSIGNDAFSSCFNLKTVTFESTGNPIPTLGKIVFSGCRNLKAILVPSEAAYAAYKAAGAGSGWDQTVNGHSLRSLLAPATISVAKNEWSTYCHNYGVAYSPSEGVTVHTVDGLSADGKSVNTKQVEGNLVSPGTPLLLNYSSTGDITLTANVDVEVTPSDKDIVDDGGTSVCFIGNASGSDLVYTDDALKDIIHEGHDASGTVSYVLRNGEFVIVRSNSGLKAHRCLLNVSTTTSSARMLSIARGSEATVISTPESAYVEIFNRSSEQQKIDGGYLEFFKDEDCSSSNSLTLNHVSGLTDGKVYIKATPDNFHLLKGFLPVVEKCSESGSGQARTRVLKTGAIEVTAVAGKTGVYQFTMPADGSNVAASAPFPEKAYKTKVKYLKWNGTDKKLEEATTDDNTKVYVLDGTENVLGVLDTGNDEIWYVAESSNLNYQDIELGGYVHLILADGAKMTCGGKIYDQDGAPDNFTIYGQSTNDGMGKLTVSNTNDTDYGINVSNITINGGSIEVTSSNHEGIYTEQSLTINGGRVKAYGKYGIYTTGNVRINGGQVEATGTTSGIHYVGNCTLGWTDPDNDYIKVSSIEKDMETLDVSAVKRFVAYNMASEDDISANCIIGSATSETILNRTDINNIAGKTLRPLDGYYVKDLAGLTFSGKTDTDGKPKPDFTITDGTPAVTTPYYIYKAGAVGIVTPDYGHDGVEISGTNVPDDIGVNDTRTLATFQMPANDVTVTDMKFFAEDVAYMDWNESTKTLKSAVAPKAYILTGGGATTLPGGWYVVMNTNTTADADGHSIDAAYTGMLRFTGATHLILADGAEMSVDNQEGGSAIANVARLDIYGQKQGTGALSAKSYNSNAIYLTSDNSGSTSSLTINGGKVSANTGTNYQSIYVGTNYNSTASVTVNGGVVIAGGSFAISAEAIIGTATITINGGKVTAKGGNYGIYADSRGSNSSAVTITGGQVEATGNAYGIYTQNGDITLNLTNGSDFIKASSYEADGSVKIPAGKALACTIGEYTTVMGSTDADYIFNAPGNTTIEYINGQTLVVAKPLPDAAGKSYIAYCSDNGNWILNNTNAKVYVVIGYNLATGQVILKEVTGNLTDEIPNGVPVIIGGASLSDLWLVGEEKLSDAAAGAVSGGRLANFFVSDGATTVGALLTEALGPTADLSDYVLFMLSGDGIFKPVSATATSVPAKGTCLLAVSKVDILTKGSLSVGGTGGARTLSIALGGETTGIEEMAQGDMQNAPSDGSWYDLQGRKLSGRPTRKGIYIRNGRAVIIP